MLFRSRLATAGGTGGVQVEPLGAFAMEPRPGGGAIALGDLVADQLVRVALAITFPMGEVDRSIGLTLALADADGRLEESTTLTWRYADNAANDSQPRDRSVDRVVARAYADRARRDVVAMNREGRFEEARRALHAVAKRIRGYAGHDDVLRGIVAELEREAEHWSVRQDELSRKRLFADMSYQLHSRQLSSMPLRRTDRS